MALHEPAYTGSRRTGRANRAAPDHDGVATIYQSTLLSTLKAKIRNTAARLSIGFESVGDN
eukprot:1700854-Pyramimonas_sp.AAC.2